MRIFTIILSIFFLGLNFVPCNDNSTATEDSQVLIELDQNANDHQHNTTGDSCSPFCQCHCCHVHVTQFNIANFQPITPEISTVEFIHFNSFGKEISKQLLQPPRV
ncbi:DUF6660 family protein [Mesonia aquimarina]|uniref:DUF6660 family protein n=1 Tax=Mesonia aquimarina TaxID=1504967 RepID=UPI000EF5B86C|nr:DUF6660 family protein [Mesonia aquimarina]